MREVISLELQGKCHMCGKCCQAIHIPVSSEVMKEAAEFAISQGLDDTNSDHIFVHNHWMPITKEEAFAINPHLKHLEENRGEDRYSNMHWYTCTQLDRNTGLCSVHELRPRVCSGYPWYEAGVPNPDEGFYSPDCGYKVDVEQMAKILQNNTI